MTPWRRVVALVSRLRDLRDRRRLEGEAEQELELHVELLTSQYVRAGIAPGEARRMARVKFGGVGQIKESLRDRHPPRNGRRLGPVRNLVIRQGMAVALVGVALGIASAYGLSRLVAGFLFEVAPRDPLVFVAVPLLLATVALAGMWLPARRAARVAPAAALRLE